MKFNEKLIELRKKRGISQEELGYKLNVTRQTISKWELGQTTPEMDKLIEISKLFNMSVDELINESDNFQNNTDNVIQDRPIKQKSENKKIGIIVVAVLVGVIILGGAIISPILNGVKNMFGMIGESFNGIGSIFEKVDEQNDKAQNILNIAGEQYSNIQNTLQNVMDKQEEFNNDFNETQKEIEETKNEIEQQQSQFEIDSYNSTFEFYQGTKIGSIVEMLFDKVITNNKKKENKITVKFLGQELTDSEQIKDMKKNLENRTEYEVSFEYGQDGYIYEAVIEELE